MYVFIVKPINKRKWNYQQKVIPRRNAINKNVCWGLYEYQWEWIECVSLKISYHLYLLRISYLSYECVTSTGQRSKFRVKNATICLQILFFYCFSLLFLLFFTFFLMFFIKKLCFYYFDFFFWRSIKFLQQNINQSEAGIGDKKLTMEMHGYNVEIIILIPFAH